MFTGVFRKVYHQNTSICNTIIYKIRVYILVGYCFCFHLCIFLCHVIIKIIRCKFILWPIYMTRHNMYMARYCISTFKFFFREIEKLKIDK